MAEPGGKILHKTSFGVLSYQPEIGRLTMVRTSEAMRIEEFAALVDELMAAVEGLPLHELHLLFDVRAVVGRNDDAFEAASLALRRRFIVHFGRVVVLVRTLAGRLQGQRFAREDRSSSSTLVTNDLAEVEAFFAEKRWGAKAR